jgi:hypothetical protein
VVTETTTLLVPATTVPMAPEIRCVFGNDDKVPNANVDDALATRAHVALACLIRLDRVHHVLAEPAQEFGRAIREPVGWCSHGRQNRREAGTPSAFLGSYFVTPT